MDCFHCVDTHNVVDNSTRNTKYCYFHKAGFVFFSVSNFSNTCVREASVRESEKGLTIVLGTCSDYAAERVPSTK